ncbi:ABC transporter ATP-binding protein [Salinigranum halophilum]|jgi:ABC-type branched-subunit amino acid transport system ATPase component|uniref:ABC transporter ATP-binding protein n=1 Tax=Salinigranum halophilum TaxID=2565931 RepID=UPI001F3F538A|nr:ABC transporter ATP-binding protein [Salinigranum halophilum]
MTAAESPATDGQVDRPRLVGRDIVTGYGSSEILHGVSVESHDGVTCIFGPNGSGKSTLIKALNGMVPVWSGAVTYGETDLTAMGPNEVVASGIITLPQDGGLFPNLTVRENLRLGGYTVSDKSVVDERLEAALAAFPDLRDKLSSKARALSGGQQMMVSFGRAMISDSDVFLLDEPSAGLSPTLVDDVIDQVRTLVDHGAQVVLVEQNVRAALRIADHVYILAQGKTQFDGPATALSEEDELIELYLGLE